MAANGEGGAPGTAADPPFIGNPRVRRKDAKVVTKALKREKNNTVLNNAYGGNHAALVRPTGVTLRRLEHRWDEWQREAKDLVLAYNSYLVQSRNDGEGNQRLCNRATDLIDSTRATVTELEIDPIGLFPFHLINAYFIRCVLKFALQDYRGAIENATDGLTLYYEAGEDLLKEAHLEKGNEAQALITRGMSLARLVGVDGREGGLSNDDAIEQLERSICDLKACCAAIRLRGSALSVMHPTLGKATSELLETMTFLKIKTGAARPHYTETERTKVQKELGLGIYKDRFYRCLNCNEAPSKTVKLHLCSRCKSVWLCSQACMKNVWKKGHKQVCKDMGIEAGVRSEVVATPDELKPAIEEAIAQRGFVLVLICAEQEPLMMVNDDATGRLFDSVSDENLYFSPSEDDLNNEIRRQRKLPPILIL
jgi:hypothetical protein